MKSESLCLAIVLASLSTVFCTSEEHVATVSSGASAESVNSVYPSGPRLLTDHVLRYEPPALQSTAKSTTDIHIDTSVTVEADEAVDEEELGKTYYEDGTVRTEADAYDESDNAEEPAKDDYYYYYMPEEELPVASDSAPSDSLADPTASATSDMSVSTNQNAVKTSANQSNSPASQAAGVIIGGGLVVGIAGWAVHTIRNKMSTRNSRHYSQVV